MRLLFRLAVLGLAAVGAKTLYEKYKPTIDSYRGTGSGGAASTGTPSSTTTPSTSGAGGGTPGV